MKATEQDKWAAWALTITAQHTTHLETAVAKKDPVATKLHCQTIRHALDLIDPKTV